MRLWDENKPLCVGVILAVLVWLAFRWIALGGVRGELGLLVAQNSARADQLAKYTPESGIPIERAVEGLDREERALQRVRRELSGLEFPLDERFADIEREQARIYFEEQLDRVVEVAKAGTVTYGPPASRLGFKGELLKEKEPDLLRRLALADHVRRAAESAGIETVLSAGHGSIEFHGEETPVYVCEYPMSVTVRAHERSLIQFLHFLQKRDKCSPVKSLSIKVTNAESGSFVATVLVNALFVEKKVKPRKDQKDDVDPYNMIRRGRGRL